MANRFRRATTDVIRFVNGLTDDQWQTVDAAEGLSIGAMVHHLEAGDRLTRAVLEAMTQGAERPPSVTELATADRERLQAREATQFGRLSRAAIIEVLRRQSADVARTVSSLSSTDLDRVHTFWGETVLTREFIRRWIEDIGKHLAEMRSSVGSRA
jgi:Mycothiol maleylpyruvate isomerase N-terminal domain